MFEALKNFIKKPVSDEWPALTSYLVKFGFELVSTYSTGDKAQDGYCQAYSSSECDLAFFFANSQLYGTNQFVLSDCGSWRKDGRCKYVSLSYYIEGFYPQVSALLAENKCNSEALVEALNGKLPSAVALFNNTRKMGKWQPTSNA